MIPTKSSGNVLFLILIAVVLFAALSYAITSSNRGSGSSISKEKARANAAALLQYGASLRAAVLRMKTSNYCTDTTFDFNNSIFKRNDGTVINTSNSNAPANQSCDLFRASGGNITPIIPNPDSLDLTADTSSGSAWKIGHSGVRIFQVRGIGLDASAGTTAVNDIVFLTNFINKETCMAINDLVNVTNPSNSPPLTNMGTTGAYSNGSLSSSELINTVELFGKPVFCGQADSGYQFMQVLVER